MSVLNVAESRNEFNPGTYSKIIMKSHELRKEKIYLIYQRRIFFVLE